MQVVVERAGDSSPPEVALIEFQGDLKTTDGQNNLDSRVLGQLYYAASDGTPIMTIGHHILHGKVQPLPKPFLLMRPERAVATADGGAGEEKVVYKVYGVAKKKVIFKNRPKPIISPDDVAKKWPVLKSCQILCTISSVHWIHTEVINELYFYTLIPESVL